MIIRETVDHWYLYGLIVTEHRLLAAFFREVENRIGRRPCHGDFTPNSKAAALFREFASLKIVWPHRRKGAPGSCHYLFENGEYPRPEVQRASPAIPLSRYEAIFRELDSGFYSVEDIRLAEGRLDTLFEGLSVALD